MSGYHRFGDPNWDPAKNPVPEQAPLKGSARVLHGRRQARIAKFAAAREAGRTVEQAAAEAGVNIRTGQVYEAERLADLPERAS